MPDEPKSKKAPTLDDIISKGRSVHRDSQPNVTKRVEHYGNWHNDYVRNGAVDEAVRAIHMGNPIEQFNTKGGLGHAVEELYSQGGGKLDPDKRLDEDGLHKVLMAYVRGALEAHGDTRLLDSYEHLKGAHGERRAREQLYSAFENEMGWQPGYFNYLLTERLEDKTLKDARDVLNQTINDIVGYSRGRAIERATENLFEFPDLVQLNAEVDKLLAPHGYELSKPILNHNAVKQRLDQLYMRDLTSLTNDGYLKKKPKEEKEAA